MQVSFRRLTIMLNNPNRVHILANAKGERFADRLGEFVRSTPCPNGHEKTGGVLVEMLVEDGECRHRVRHSQLCCSDFAALVDSFE